MPLYVARSYGEMLSLAKEAERNDELNDAASFYEKALKQEPHQEFPYKRLMTIYRRQKEYDKELRVIRQGIKVFEEFNKQRTQTIIGKNKKALQLSSSLAKVLGQKDRKGKSLYHPEPLNTWIKRADLVEKKLEKNVPPKKALKKKKKA